MRLFHIAQIIAAHERGASFRIADRPTHWPTAYVEEVFAAFGAGREVFAVE